MAKIIIFILMFVLGVLLALLPEESGIIRQNAPKESFVTKSYNDMFLLDSTSFVSKQDSVIKDGNIDAYIALMYHFASIKGGGLESAYYSIIMANKFSNNDAFSNIFTDLELVVDTKTLAKHSFLAHVLIQNLALGAEHGNAQCARKLAEFYRQGILLSANKEKSEWYYNMAKMMEEKK